VSLRRQQAALVAYRAVSDVAGKGAFFVVTLVAARRLSQDAFGLFSLATTVGWIAAVATDFGIQLHLARAVAQHPGNAGALLRAWLRVRIWTAALALATVAVGLALTSRSPAFTRAIVLFTLVYVVNGLIEFLHYFYRGLARTDLESTLTLWQRVAMLILAVAALWWWPDVTVLAVAMAIPALATFWYSARLARRLASSESSSNLSNPSSSSSLSDPSNLRDSVGSVIPIGAGIVLSALYFRIDVFLVQAWQGTTAVALYNAVFRLVDALRLLPAAVLAVALPVLFTATSRRVLVKLSAILTAAALVVSLALWVGANFIIPMLYGNRYADAVPAFRILLMAFPLMSLNYALTHQLIGWHGHRAYAVMCAAALGFNVALNIALIPSIGIVGAAWATVATELVITFGCVIALARISHLSTGSDSLTSSNPSDISNLSNLSNPSNLSSVVLS
jgi:O-antigen/teichoic acid export membrane protein